jgi:hypothetical protein
MSLIVRNLRMSVAERLRQHDSALTAFMSLRQALLNRLVDLSSKAT